MSEFAAAAAQSIVEARQPARRKRIAVASHLIRFAAVAWSLWTLAALIYFWSDRAGSVAQIAKTYSLDPAAFDGVGYWAAFAVVLVDWGVSATLVVMLWRLTSGYLAGEALTARAAERLKAVAYAGFAATLADIVARPFVFALLSTSLVAKLPFAAWLRPSDLLYAIISGFLLGLAVILGAAAEIAEDNASFV